MSCGSLLESPNHVVRLAEVIAAWSDVSESVNDAELRKDIENLIEAVREECYTAFLLSSRCTHGKLTRIDKCDTCPADGTKWCP